MTLDPIHLTRALIDIPSTSGEEHDVAMYIESVLERGGFACERHEISGRRFNLLATAGGPPRVVLCTHLDTVPPFIPSHEDDDAIYGRGACDAKGIIAAMVAAAFRLAASGVRDFALLFVVGEETDSIGAKRANADLGNIGAEVVIVGEPTDSTYVRATKGALTCTVHFKGVAAHSAYPGRGDSAIRKLVRAFQAIETHHWGEHPVLGSTTVNVGVVRGGERANIVPAEAEADLMFRLVTTPEDVLERLGLVVAPFDGSIVYSHGNDPVFMHVPKHEEWKVVSFNTDAPHLGRFGVPVLWGPGSILDAHTAEERIAKRDLLEAVGVYERLVRSILEDKEILIDGRLA